MPRRANQGARFVTEEGSRSKPSRYAVSAETVPSLRAIRPTSRTSPPSHPSSVQPTAASRRRLARGAREERWPSAPQPSGELALTGRPASMVRAWLAACPPSGERGLSQAARSERNAREAEANGIGAGGDALTPRTGEDRTLEVMLARRHRCRSRSDVARRREAGALHFTRSGSVRGRSPSPQAHVRKCDPEDEEAAAHPRSGSIT